MELIEENSDDEEMSESDDSEDFEINRLSTNAKE